jgi:hypothetical protein
MQPPAYFEPIRARAATRWDQLEHDPDLAAPWHQLFKQVQSPRHVLSELLQNADDAGATEASVAIRDGAFEFSHNGEDFIEAHFASLCRFGYSNKRALHTIGFRGIGFKSTFSLGPRVELRSPSLSVAFHRRRFTEPVWLDDAQEAHSLTTIRVVIEDEYRLEELRKNLMEWMDSAAALLFFRSIRCLRIRDREVRWESHGPGPLGQTEWMALASAPDKKYLVVRSSEASFPPDALEEIRQERMVGIDDDMEFPPCRVEIVLGMQGRLFVVLPTGVKTALPFACNAPFMQDPARVKIKDPDISPVNRWLLARAGQLAAKAMVGWLRRDDLSLEDRCGAYQLLPDLVRDDGSLEATCTRRVQVGFDEFADKNRILLTEEGALAPHGGCVSIPSSLHEVWTSDEIRSAFLRSDASLLCRHVRPETRRNLITREYVEEMDRAEVLAALSSRSIPKPATWAQLLTLWEYVAQDVVGLKAWDTRYRAFHILPVQGRGELYDCTDVVHVSERRQLQSAEDWALLSKYLLTLDAGWLGFLDEERIRAMERQDRGLRQAVGNAERILQALGLDQRADASRIIEQVEARLSENRDRTIDEYVRLAQIAAKLGAQVSTQFHYVTRSRQLGTVGEGVVSDLRGDVDAFVDREWCDRHVLHDSYTRLYGGCTEAEWRQWVASPSSGLLTFVPLQRHEKSYYGKKELEQALQQRGYGRSLPSGYSGGGFVLLDWDFPASCWPTWQKLAVSRPDFWVKLVERVLQQPPHFWNRALSATAVRRGRGGKEALLADEGILPAWIVKLRSLPCLRDTWGRPAQPAELLRRTPETEALLEVDPFIAAELDTEATRPLLTLLGVRDTPAGPERIIERLVALSRSSKPPVEELDKWYRRLDRLLARANTDDLQRAKAAFLENKVIYAEDGSWATSAEVFLSADEADAPGAAVVRASVRDLALWQKLGVAERPTADVAIAWLSGLPSRQPISPDTLPRVKALLARHPLRVWSECRHWLNLEAEWVPAVGLEYSLSMQSLVPWKNLFPAIRRRTADFQKLNAETCGKRPFSDLASLASAITERLREGPRELGRAEQQSWMVQLGNGLSRVVLDDAAETARVRSIGHRLAESMWQVAAGLEAVPYVNGEPAGTAHRAEALWAGTTLYVDNRPAPRLAQAVAHELGRAFDNPAVAEAIKLCYARGADFVDEYLAEAFELAEQVEDVATSTTSTSTSRESDGTSLSNDSAGSAAVSMEDSAQLEACADEDSDVIGDVPTVQGGAAADELEADDVTEDLEESAGSERPPREESKPKPPRVSLIERFATRAGYRKDALGRYRHPDGTWIAKENDSAFPWVRYSASGEVLMRYWTTESCMEREPLEVAVDVWGLCEKFPDTYGIILVGVNEDPIDISGRRLCQMRERGELTLHPATYRLVKATTADGLPELELA